MTMADFDWKARFGPIIDELEKDGLEHWATQLQQQLTHRFEDRPHGDLDRWQAALDQLPGLTQVDAQLDQSAVTLTSRQPLTVAQREQLELGLRGLMPWRKGPFNFFGTYIDTEWRSDWKWDRVSPYLSDLSGRRILDVGCGSGYHCWRMQIGRAHV